MKKLTWEELLVEAERKYPKGTKYKCLHNAYKGCSDGIILPDKDTECIRTNSGAKCCYEDGNWATITGIEITQTYEIY